MFLFFFVLCTEQRKLSGLRDPSVGYQGFRVRGLGYRGLYRDYIGLYRGYIGIMEKKMEITIRVWGLGFRGRALGFWLSGLVVGGRPTLCFRV